MMGRGTAIRHPALRMACLAACLAALRPTALPATESGWSLELLASDDISLVEGASYLSFTEGEWKSVLSYRRLGYWIDYQPPAGALTGGASEREETKDSLRLALQMPAGEGLSLHGEFGGYVGYSDFQSLWIDEYYHQLFEGYPGYETSQPMGWDYLVGVRWDYLPTSAFVKLSLFGGHDRMPPAWEPVIGGDLVSKGSSIESTGARLELENALSRRFRTHNRLTMLDATAREPRWSFESMNHYALSESWVVKGTAGGSLEDPDFEALWASLAIERDHRRTWFYGIGARFYTDSGETEDLALYGTSAPPATTVSVSGTLRWIQGGHQASLGIGPCWTRYDEDPGNASPVAGLYTDRTWLSLQAAWSFQF